MNAASHRNVSWLKSICFAICLGFVTVASAQNLPDKKPAASAAPIAIYDADPNHIWNRLHRALFVRTAPDAAEYGGDALDPLFWANTNHLLIGDSHREAFTLLDEFIRQHAATLIKDPLKRAVRSEEHTS